MNNPQMTRCTIRHPDGRQCCRPGPHPGKKCLVARPGRLTYDTAHAIGKAWSYPDRLADSAARGAIDGGCLDADAFVRATESITNAVLAGAARKRNAAND